MAVGADLSRVVLGGDFNSQPAALSADLLVSFFAAGGRMVETARSYSDGHGEAVLQAARGDFPEDGLLITKVGHPHAGRPVLSAEQVRIEFERSLATAPGIDAVLLHRDNPLVDPLELVAPLRAALDEGTVTYIGVSNWELPRIEAVWRDLGAHSKAFWSSSQRGLARPLHAPWSGTVVADDAMMAWHEERAVPLLAWSGSSRGYFALADDESAPDDVLPVFDSFGNRRLRAACREIAAGLSCAPASVALAWSLMSSPVLCPVVGPRSTAELDQVLEATTIEPSPAHHRRLSTLRSSAACPSR